VRSSLLLAACALALAAGCGGGDDGSAPAPPPAPTERPAALGPLEPWTPPARPARATGMTLEEIVGGNGAPGNAMALGQDPLTVGRNRFAFAIVQADGRLLEADVADVYVARGDEDAIGPFPARYLPLDAPHVHADGAVHVHEEDPAHIDAGGVFVASIPFDAPGSWYAVAVATAGGKRVTAGGAMTVAAERTEPAPGDRAPASETPTLTSTGGDVSALTTRRPPDRPLLRTSVVQSLRAGRPFLVLFSTPAFCTSRLCGPATDVLLALAQRYRKAPIDFIHVEVFAGNDPNKGYNRWMREWRLETEPWAFMVGADGRIDTVIQGPQTANELAAVVERELKQAG
jgi:hypothetical protein